MIPKILWVGTILTDKYFINSSHLILTLAPLDEFWSTCKERLQNHLHSKLFYLWERKNNQTKLDVEEDEKICLKQWITILVCAFHIYYIGVGTAPVWYTHESKNIREPVSIMNKFLGYVIHHQHLDVTFWNIADTFVNNIGNSHESDAVISYIWTLPTQWILANLHIFGRRN